MPMVTYAVKVKEPGDCFAMQMDPEQSASPIVANFHGGENDWQYTPYQVADADHNCEIAAKMVNEYFADKAGEDAPEIESVTEA